MSECLYFRNDFCITLERIHYRSDQIPNLFGVMAITVKYRYLLYYSYDYG